MKAAVLKGIKNIKIEEIEKPVIGDNEVLVKVKAVGICGSDVHYFLEGRIGDQIVKGDHILGHEASGEVEEVGKNITKVKPGMRVAIEPGIPCGKCELCTTGRYNICPDVQFLGTPPVNGAYQEYLAYPEDYLYPMPDSMSFEEGELIETLSVGVYAEELSELKSGNSAAILGCGPVGLVTLKAIKAAGADQVFVTDLIDERLEFAGKHENVITINASKEDPVEKINKMTGGRGVDVVFEAAGAAETPAQAIKAVRIGGKIVWIGIPSDDLVSIDPHIMRKKELVIKCVRRFKHTYEKAIQLVSSGSVVVKDMITHRFDLEDIDKAFRLVENYEDGIMKGVILL